MKILIYVGYISENAILMKFCYLIRFTLTYTTGLKYYEKFLAKFHSGTLRVMDPMRLTSLFQLLLGHQLEFVLNIWSHHSNRTCFSSTGFSSFSVVTSSVQFG